MRRHGRTPRGVLRALAVLTAVLVTMVTWPQTAGAHGSVINPASRNYGCWERWGNDHLNPRMQQEDPMCWQAFQDNPNAMWNWNGLYRDNVGGNHQAAVPDGQLCSGGLTEGGRYRSLDTPGPWKMTNVSTNFTVHLYDQARHGADYFLVYVTRQGYDATTQPLRWSDLELVKTTGRYAPAENITFDVSAPGRSGRHVVFTIWQASHMDQAYYICSDVNFV
ncbi:lytic polysaccharide monooxygenase auxiliary activity family 9 protein [Thermostaphylospora chromogena]|uniref:Chitin-binding protein n=1 Tax=Thermostaphylospora chromogena TaxID=35622 RepID=A0A1H1DF01_9ACTN|nr:lytic polysaccharide monooxygenase auxiliary activity family 9 protein [Thermostaphylospora chromogena]SDQ74778.1 chitin-binding protein [Thermostaphylospora chromogena]